MRKTEPFKRVTRKAGIVEYWRAKGWPRNAIPPLAMISRASDAVALRPLWLLLLELLLRSHRDQTAVQGLGDVTTTLKTASLGNLVREG